jgi:hypothetical protein
MIRFSFLALIVVALAASGIGCSNNPTTTAQFTASATPVAPGLVKLLEKTHSGSRVVVDAVLFGPEPGLDLTAFHFGIKIGSPDRLRFVGKSSYAQNALVAGAGQTIAIDVDGMSDASLVQVNVEKLGGGAGNGVAAASAVVIELSFDVSGDGAATLTLVGLGNNPPQAVDSNRAPIAAVNFDAASASVRGVTTGGGGY